MHVSCGGSGGGGVDPQVVKFCLDGSIVVEGVDLRCDDRVDADARGELFGEMAFVPCDDAEGVAFGMVGDSEREVFARLAQESWSFDECEVAEEDAWLWVVAAEGGEGFELFDRGECAFSDRRGAVELERGDEVCWVDGCVGDVDEGRGEVFERVEACSKSGGHVVPAEALEVLRAFAQGGVQVKPVDGPCASFDERLRVVDVHQDGGPSETFDESGTDDADDARVPVFVGEDDGAGFVAGHACVVCELGGMFGDLLFDVAASSVECVE